MIPDDDRYTADGAHMAEPAPVAISHRKLHTTVSLGRKKAINGDWISLGISSVLNPPQPHEEPWGS